MLNLCNLLLISPKVKRTVKLLSHFQKHLCRKLLRKPYRSNSKDPSIKTVYQKEIYLKAMKYAEENNLDFTDDCQLLETLGEKVRVVIGSQDNIKLTTQNDITLAENILKRKQV